MKKILFLFILVTQYSFAQNDVVFQINHILDGTENFTTTSKGQNDAGTNFTISRMQYYISDISITHDGGQTLVFDDTVILVDAYTNTSIDLGNYVVTDLESVIFNLGVKQALNHLDPSAYPMTHPLAPKSPSMHWGWTSGYRFFALEGLASGQVFELHGVGDALYEEIVVVFNETSAENGTLIIDINAEYNEALKNLDLVSGFSVHGDENDSEIVTEVTNFRENIFTAKEGEVIDPTSINDFKELNNNFNVFPNPTTGLVNLNNLDFNKVSIYSVIGELVSTEEKLNQKIFIKTKGIHILHFLDEENNLISINKVVVH